MRKSNRSKRSKSGKPSTNNPPDAPHTKPAPPSRIVPRSIVRPAGSGSPSIVVEFPVKNTKPMPSSLPASMRRRTKWRTGRTMRLGRRGDDDMTNAELIIGGVMLADFDCA